MIFKEPITFAQKTRLILLILLLFALFIQVPQIIPWIKVDLTLHDFSLPIRIAAERTDTINNYNTLNDSNIFGEAGARDRIGNYPSQYTNVK